MQQADNALVLKSIANGGQSNHFQAVFLQIGGLSLFFLEIPRHIRHYRLQKTLALLLMNNPELKNRRVLIYGAYGYTGKLILEEAVRLGLQPVIAGRNEEMLKPLADQHQLRWKAFPLEDEAALDAAVADAELVLHVAGPYIHTAKPMVKACLKHKTHYLDVTGELEIFEWIARQHQKAVEAGIVLLPGTGFDVVPTDCTAAWLKEMLPDATHLELAFRGVGSLSRGTALTMAENIHKGGAIRKDGKIQGVPAAYQTRQINFDGKERTAVTIPWGDVSTAYHSTGIPNIMVYMAAHPKSVRQMKWMNAIRPLLAIKAIRGIIQQYIRKSVKGPDEQIRETTSSYIWGEARNQKSEVVTLRLETAEGYKLTAMTAVRSAIEVLTKSLKPGFYTPSKAFGPDFILQVPGSKKL